MQVTVQPTYNHLGKRLNNFIPFERSDKNIFTPVKGYQDSLSIICTL